MSADYRIVRDTEVGALLDQGYVLHGGPAYDPVGKYWVQGLVRGPQYVAGHTGAPNRPAVTATQDLSDVSLDLVTDKVYDADGKEIKIEDRVLVISGTKAGFEGVVTGIDPLFSSVIIKSLVTTHKVSSVAVRLQGWATGDRR